MKSYFSKWFPDVTTSKGVQAARKAGVAGALGFTAMLTIGIIAVFLVGSTSGAASRSLEDKYFAVGGIVAEAVFVLFAAWRLHIGKGLIVGSLLIALFVIELVAKFVDGTARGGWLIVYVAILCGLTNGVRGARAARKGLVDLAEVF